MAKRIDAQLKSIQGLFSSTSSQDSVLGKDGIYIIPEYQRAYNWRYNEQCDKLWQDIEAFIESKENDTYFFGSIIINSEKEQLHVIDGQQRVTTFILLLKALLVRINSVLKTMPSDDDSKAVKEALENRRKSILGCLYSIDEDDTSMVTSGRIPLSDLSIKYDNKSINEEYADDVKTILRHSTYDTIEANVKKIKYKQGDNKYTNFFRNFKYFILKLNAYDSTTLNILAKMLLSNCQVIVIVSYQTEEAIEIFNSLNSTGMPLTDADILSAKLYSNYGTDKSGFNDKWGDIIRITNLLKAQGIVTIDDVLNQYMYILRAKRNEKDTTLPGVRRYFTFFHPELLKDPQRFIADFEEIIGIWQNEAEAFDDPESGNELNVLRQILFELNNNFKFYYATYFFFNKDKPCSEKLLFVKALLKLFVLLSISDYGYSSSFFKVFLISVNMEIGAGVSTEALVRLIDTHIRKRFDKTSIKQTIIESNPDNGLIFLNEYLFAKERHERVCFSTRKIEIEHIMPSSGKNIVAVRDDANMDGETFRRYVNKIGNRILLEQYINGSVSNDWFRVKKQNSINDKRGYKDSVFPIAKSLVSYAKDKWEKDDIDTATEKAAKRITDYIFSDDEE